MARPDVFETGAEVVVKLPLNEPADFSLGAASPCEEDRRRDSLGALDSIGMIMAHRRGPSRPPKHLVQHGLGKADGTDAHGRAVPPTIVWLLALRLSPRLECAAVARPWVSPGVLLEQLHRVAAVQD